MSRRTDIALVVWSLLTLTALGQTTTIAPSQGAVAGFVQPSQRGASLHAVRYERSELTGGYVPMLPIADNLVGLYDGSFEHDADDYTMDVLGGALGARVFAGHRYVVGFDARGLYDDSSGADYYDFGPLASQPETLDAAMVPDDCPVPRLLLHVSPERMWQTIGGDPTSYAAWMAGAPIAPGTPGTIANELLMSPGHVLWTLLPQVRSLVAPRSPNGGSLIGMNITAQIAVMDPIGSVPGATRIRLSNPVFLQASLGPPIKIGVGSGNFGPLGQPLVFQFANPSIGITAMIASDSGGTIEVPTHIIGPGLVRVAIPPQAETSGVVFRARTVTGVLGDPEVVVVTPGVPVPFVNGSTPTLTPGVFNGVPVLGAAVVGTLGSVTGPTGSLQLNAPAVLGGYAFVVDVYPYLPGSGLAGLGSNVPIGLQALVSGSPISGAANSMLLPIPGGGVRRRHTFTSLSPSLQLELTNTSVGAFPFLVVIRATAANTP